MGGDVLITVKAPYFNDPAPPGGLPGQAYFGLWDYEVELQTKVERRFAERRLFDNHGEGPY